MANVSFDQFRRDNVVTTIPTTLAYGQEVYYKDPNGNMTLWVGHEDGSAWPACGYKEYVALLTQTGTNAPVATVSKNDIGNVTYTREFEGSYEASLPSEPSRCDATLLVGGEDFTFQARASYSDSTTIPIYTVDSGVPNDNILGGAITTVLQIRIYP